MTDPGQRRLTLEDLWLGATFLRRLPGFLRHPVSPRDALVTLRRRLDGRGTDFLALVRDRIYGYPASPYRHLLRAAGCEYGDLERLDRKSVV